VVMSPAPSSPFLEKWATLTEKQVKEVNLMVDEIVKCPECGSQRRLKDRSDIRVMVKCSGTGASLGLILFSGHKFFVLVFGEVAAVAKWLVGGFAASAESDAVSNFIGLSVCGFDGDAASHPDWAAAR
jgi:DNA-directed RNA polymerase subunit RPC12/RpoP